VKNYNLNQNIYEILLNSKDIINNCNLINLNSINKYIQVHVSKAVMLFLLGEMNSKFKINLNSYIIINEYTYIFDGKTDI